MKDIRDKEACCGCMMCKAVCAHDAIEVKTDDEGFSYTNIVLDKCFNCGQCTETCAFNNALRSRKNIVENINTDRDIYVGRSLSKDIVSESRSGGIFTILSDYIIERGGCIYGCIMNEDLEAVHCCAYTKSDRDKMRGSKYVQSYIDSNMYGEIKKKLENGEYVLFSGTSCQVDALRSFVKKEYENLLCVDILCHGTVSPLVLQKYIDVWEETIGGKCIGINFRNKSKYGWTAHVESLVFDVNNERTTVDSTIYRDIFYGHYALRPSCYVCPYKSLEHPGDITLGDCWGIEKVNTKYADDKGCSLIFINSDKGDNYFNNIKHELSIEKTQMQEALFQPPLSYPFTVDESERAVFWKDILGNDSRESLEKYGHGKFDV